jgi:hypothetical protein
MQMLGKRRHARFGALLLLTILLLFVPVALGQSAQGKPPPPADPNSAEKGSQSDNGPPLTTFEEELRAKRAIKTAEKEHQANLERAREISQIGKELQEVLKKRSALNLDDNKKLDRLEKLTKKVRGEAGGGENEVKMDNQPNDLTSTAGRIVEVSDCLSKNVQSTPRQVVSAAVIDNANVLLELIRMMRTFSR